MQHPRFTWSRTPALLCGALVWGLAATAGAQEEEECSTDADCGHGFVCEKGQISACAAIDVICAEGEECVQPSCEPTSYAYCVLAPCEQDADCPDSFTCASNEYEDCTYPDATCTDTPPDRGGDPGDGAGDPEIDPDGPFCTRPEPTSCETVVERYCAAPWELPCTEDADCGAGFTCEELESCGCSGSAGAGDSAGSNGSGVDGGTPDPAPMEPECSCEPSGDFWCMPVEVVCTEDADCADGWSCIGGAVAVSCGAPAGDGAEPVCEQSEPSPMTCQPPYYGRGGDFAVAAERHVAASGTAPVPGAGNGVVGEDAADDGSLGGSASDPDSNAAGGGKSSGGGCSVGGASAGGSQLAWLLAPLFVLGWSRRRTPR